MYQGTNALAYLFKTTTEKEKKVFKHLEVDWLNFVKYIFHIFFFWVDLGQCYKTFCP
jgi:hypothetical protein